MPSSSVRRTPPSASALSRPFRLEPKVASPEDLAAVAASWVINRALIDPSIPLAPGAHGPVTTTLWGPAPPDIFGDAAQIARAMRTVAKRDVTGNDLYLWSGHPDERVVVALAQQARRIGWKRGTKGQEGQWRQDIQERLARRAYAINTDEQLLWNPVLDAVVAAGILPTVYVDHKAVPRSVLAERLIPWVAAQTDPREVELLLRFKAEDVHTVALTHATCVDADMLRTALTHPHLALALASNPTTPNDARRTLAERAVAAYQAGLMPEMDFPGELSPEAQARAEARTNGEKVLAALDAAGYRIPPELLAPLVDLVEAPGQGTKYADIGPHTLRVLQTVPHAFDTATLHRLVASPVGQEAFLYVLDGLARHAAADLALWKAIARRAATALRDSNQRHGAEQSLGLLVNQPGMVTDPEMRALFLSMSSFYVYGQLLPHLSIAEYVEYITSQAARDGRLDGGLVNFASPAQRTAIPESLWRTLIDIPRPSGFSDGPYTNFDALVRIPGARADAALRALMWKAATTAPSWTEDPTRGFFATLMHAPESTDDEVRSGFRTLADANGKAALDLWEAQPATAARVLPEDFTPILQSSDSRLRQRALLLAARLPTASPLATGAPEVVAVPTGRTIGGR